MKKCKYCMSEIEEQATVCPICRKNQNQKRNINILIIIAGVIFIFVIIFLFNKEKNDLGKQTNSIRENSTDARRKWLNE